MSLSDFVHDPVFLTIMGAFIGVFLSALVAYWNSVQQRTKKEITCQVSTDSLVVSVNEEVKDRIKIEFDGQKVEEMSIAKLKIWNSGNVSVKPGDYIDPITFNFGERKVLDVSIVNMEPGDLMKPEDAQKFLADNKPLPQKEKGTITLPKFHINSQKRTGLQESLTLRVLLSGAEGSTRVEGRIDDGRIRESNLEVEAQEVVHFAIGKLNDYLLWFLMVLEVALLMEFFLVLSGAAPNNFFTGFIYALTLIPLYPFNGIVPNTSLGTSGAAIEWSTLIAMAAYFLLFYALGRFLYLLISRSESPRA